ncbi:MAG TPA: ABC transporter ATP-binding protein [Rhodospirillaceae bacterium]|nr:ABC transporter ATP-binding protein [Rhodospirillaceae bacterium]
MTLAIDCKEITKTYVTGEQEVQALRGIELEVDAGSLFMLVGPSGCGKTTLISVMAGILMQTSGSCQVYGQELAELNGGDLVSFRGKNIGFVFQQFNLLPSLTAAENVAVPLIIQGVKNKVAYDRAREVLDRVGLGDRWQSLPNQLSGGQQQRVAIARALVHEPRLIVCDEPTSALDHRTGQVVMDLMREVALADGRTLVIVTHDSRIFSYADRIAQMDDGQIIAIADDWQQLEGMHHHAA